MLDKLILPLGIGTALFLLGKGGKAGIGSVDNSGLGYTVIQHLKSVGKYKEDQTLISRFQASAGLKVDGKYGPKTALALVSLGLVPPLPLYWDRKTGAQDKKAYKAVLESLSRSDPSRSNEWLAAANEVT